MARTGPAWAHLEPDTALAMLQSLTKLLQVRPALCKSPAVAIVSRCYVVFRTLWPVGCLVGLKYACLSVLWP